jgi:PilZ domain-containing protein
MDDTQSSGARSVSQRTSDRIRYAYRLRITGRDSSGIPFDEAGRTQVITRDGGLLLTSLSLMTGAVIRLSRGLKAADARIVGQCGLQNEEYLYGVQFVNPLTEPFWDVNFPQAMPEGGVGKLVLQCAQCSRQELLHLSEIEMMVYESMKVVPRKCPRCHVEALWLEPVVLGDGSLVSGNAAYHMEGGPAFRRSRTVNDRKHSRVQMRNIRACLQRPGLADDVVTVTDLSRGGIGFMSLVDYLPGSRVEVAVPYTANGANVFTPAQIVRVRCRPTADIPGEFGLAYIKV